LLVHVFGFFRMLISILGFDTRGSVKMVTSWKILDDFNLENKVESLLVQHNLVLTKSDLGLSQFDN
jgi:hypothetical protein